MIPTIGIMIGGYIILRCVDILCRPAASFSSKAGQNWMIALAVIVMLATFLEISDLMFSGSPNVPRGLTR